MKTKIILLITLFSAGIFSCKDDEKVVDPIYEFVSFAGDETVNLGEAIHTEEGYPLVVQLWVFDPYKQDLTVNFEVTGNNVQKDVDFTVTPSDAITIKAGNLVSDTIWIKTINNEDANELERTIEVKIKNISEPGLKIGLGLANPVKSSITFKIQDDECSGNPICIFNQELVNNINWGGDDVPMPATSVVDKINSTVTVSGNLIDYGAFSEATLTLTLTPNAPGASTGIASFGEQETGTDSDGYEYKFIQTGTGSYDADAGTISVAYDIYYWDGGWWYWYSVTNVYSIP